MLPVSTAVAKVYRDGHSHASCRGHSAACVLAERRAVGSGAASVGWRTRPADACPLPLRCRSIARCSACVMRRAVSARPVAAQEPHAHERGLNRGGAARADHVPGAVAVVGHLDRGGSVAARVTRSRLWLPRLVSCGPRHQFTLLATSAASFCQLLLPSPTLPAAISPTSSGRIASADATASVVTRPSSSKSRSHSALARCEPLG
jgi:hypothetical protein